MSLVQDLKPQSLNQLIGQPAAVSLLEPHLKDKRRTAYLISGPSGVGKTVTAEIIARNWNPKDEPIVVNCGDSTGVAHARQLVSQFYYSSLSGNPQIFILNEAQELTPDAQRCFLDPLDKELPSTLVFTTMEPQKVLEALRDRCLWIRLNPLVGKPQQELAIIALKHLGEKRDPEPILDEIRTADLRSARTIYTAIESWHNGLSPAEAVLSPESEPEYREIANLVIQGNWFKLKGLLKKLKPSDAKPLRSVISGYLRSFLLTNGESYSTIITETLRNLCLYSAFEAGVDLSGLIAVIYNHCKKQSGK